MKKILLSTLTMLLGLTASAQSALDTDFETGAIPAGWTASAPEGNTGIFSVVEYSAESALKTENVGSNDLGGTYVLKSKAGGLRGVKTNSDNWFTSPKFTVSADNAVFSFRLAANCSYSPTVEAEEKVQMDVVVIDGDTKTVLTTIAPVNYFSWKQYAFDLSAYVGKEIQVAFHDYGNGANVYLADLKYIDNIKLTSEKPSDYSIEAVSTPHGQAEYTSPYTVRVTNYGISKGSFNVSYSYGETNVTETVNSDIAGGQSLEYTFKEPVVFTPGDTVIFKSSVTGADDAMVANDNAENTLYYICPIQTLPYSVCNVLDDEETENDDLVEPEFTKISSMVTKGNKVYWWPYDAIKYNAWIFQQADSTEKYRGIAYLYSNKAFALPAGKVYLTTTGTATGPDMHYEVYIAKYWNKDLSASPVLVGTSPIMTDVIELGGGATPTTTELTIPEAGNYTFAIRPLTTKLAQMTIIGFSLSEDTPSGIEEIHNTLPTEEGRGEAFNLAGQRINANAKGIKIINGKKIITK